LLKLIHRIGGRTHDHFKKRGNHNWGAYCENAVLWDLGWGGTQFSCPRAVTPQTHSTQLQMVGEKAITRKERLLPSWKKRGPNLEAEIAMRPDDGLKDKQRRGRAEQTKKVNRGPRRKKTLWLLS